MSLRDYSWLALGLVGGIVVAVWFGALIQVGWLLQGIINL